VKYSQIAQHIARRNKGEIDLAKKATSLIG